MWAATWERSWLFPRKSSPRHTAVAMASLVISLLVHILIIEQLPPIRIRGLQRDPASIPDPLMLVQEIRLGPSSDQENLSAALFRPEIPEDPVPPALRPAAVGGALNPLLQQPDHRPLPLSAENAPLKDVSSDAAFPTWTPRPERLEIERTFATAVRPPIPRRVEPLIARSVEAPDITFPVLTADTPYPLDLPPAPKSTGLESAPSSPPGSSTSPGPSRPVALTPGAPAGWLSRIGEILNDAGRLESSRRDLALDRFLLLELETYVPPDHPENRYFRIVIRRDGPESLPILPKDILFLLDCSQSMTQPLLDQCKKGLQKAFGSLSAGDRFNVAGFRENVITAFPEWTPAGSIEKARASWFIEQLESRGRTDLFGSFSPIMEAGPNDSRPVMTLVISDGRPTSGLTDDFQIIESFYAWNQGRIPVFALGAGSRVNRFLLDYLSRRNRGDTRVEARPDQVPDEIESFTRELSRPVLFDLSTRFSNLDSQDVFPHFLTPLFLDRPLELIGRTPAHQPDAALRISGRAADGRIREMISRLNWAEARAAGPELEQEWARLKLYSQIGDHIRNPDPKRLAEIRSLCHQFNIPLPYADRLGIERRSEFRDEE
ncbi:MAG: VWA domain-containing protein [Kiritimatiellia bacterium]|nr:VWA domain-containing protein [Kiritimatiellia bacterium]